MNEEWAQRLKYLRLRNLLEHWDEYLEKGRKGRYSNERLLKYVLDHLAELVVKEVHGSGGYGMLVGPAASKK